jgi:hypothetical protein
MPNSHRSLVDILRPAMLPMDGSIADHVPQIVAAFEKFLPAGGWSDVTYIDLTAGSCLLPMVFGARGVGRLVVNDLAPRSRLAADALFGGRPVDFSQIRGLIETGSPRLRPHVPTFHFACDYVTEPVAQVFDRLFHADLPEADAPAIRYLALLWVLGFVKSVEDGFEVLLTHAEDQLLAMKKVNWRPYVDRARRPLEVLSDLAASFNAAIAAQKCTRVSVFSEDMATLCRRLDYGTAGFVAINPPTNGLDEYIIDDQIVHSLLANRWVPLSQCRETPQEFWQSRTSAALSAVPAGSHCLVWGGDGAMTWHECCEVWQRFGAPAHVTRLGKTKAAAGWMILRRT